MTRKRNSEPDTNAPEQCPLVVGIGASAGGQAALEQLFATMPHDCGISFVVIMHLPPDGPSFLAEMLGRLTPMAVVTAEEGMELAPNTVHVIPAGRDLVVSGSRLRLEEPGGGHHPIDRFFLSLAAEMAKHAVAVVLSGFGTDGTAGVKGVKEAGGIVVVQEPGSAVNPAMPRSAIATGAVDLILPAEEIPAKIAEIAHGTCSLSPPTCRATTLDEELHTIFGIVKAATGHDFSSYKANTVIRRIERRMAVNEVAGIKKYIPLLQENPQEAHALCQDILIGVTSFFRDPEAFEMLHREIIPRLFSERDPDDPVRIWHACCATGEEVYSMAMLIREYLDEQRISTKVQFFATDIDEVAIAQARTGLYDDDIGANLGEERLRTFFTRTDGHWQVAKSLREMIVFAHHSLIKDPPFSRLDLLVCRNFLIYLNPDMQKRLISLFHQVLKPGGFLFLGSAESVGHHSDQFATVSKKWKIFARREGVHRNDMVFPLAASLRLPGKVRPVRRAGAEELNLPALADKYLMERYAPPSVVVNEKYEIVNISSRTSRFLEVPVGEPTRDILKMAREELRPALRAAIYKGFADQKPAAFRGVKVGGSGDEVVVNVLAEPLDAHPSAGKLLMVIFEPAAPPAKLHASPGGEEPLPGDETSRETLVRQLEEQLRITNEQLYAVTEQLETTHEGFLSANEELMSINEEFQSANEELQSTNEELETSKEELQALNEELVTVNAELQGKVEELNQANSDMENLFASSEIATIFLDRSLTIKRFSPAMAAIFNLIPADIGRPFRHLAGTIDWSGLPHDAEEVLTKFIPVEREVTALESGRHYLMRVLPYRAAEGKIDGIVVTLIDITEHKRMEEQTVHLASFPQINPNPVLEVDSAGTIIFANPASGKILESLGMDTGAAEVFLPADLDRILGDWDRKSETTLYREINIGDRVYGASIFLTPKFDVARIYAFDITERKRAEVALAESEQRVRRKLDSIISPEGDIGDLDLADIIDAPSLQSLVNDFYELTRMPMGLIDLTGKVLVGVGWQDLCTKFHRVNPETCANCVESDVRLSAGVPHGEYKVYKCKNNMWDVATPVMVSDRHFGNLFMGQFFFEDEPLDYEFFRSQARQYGFDENEYITALEAVPRLSRETLNTSMAFFMKLADILSRQSFSNLKLARSLAERDALMDSLQESEERFRNMFERHKAAMLLIEPDSGAIVDANTAATQFYGHSREKLRGLAIQDLNQLSPEEVAAERQKAREEQRNHFVFPHRIATGEVRWVEVYSTPIEAQGKSLLFSIIHDITERRQAEEERETTVEFLRLANESRETGDLVRAAATFFQERSGCEAVGIRLREGEDYPYYEARGFTNEFVLAENHLCAKDEAGRPICDSAGNPVIECMCGNVICERFDPSKPFFTAKGSFWSNSTTELLASTSDTDRQARTRNRCNGEGYESVALIPLRLGEERLGLLQLNDRQKGRFSPEAIALWERLADYLAVALAKFRSDEALHQSEERYRSLFNTLIEGFCIIEVLFDADNRPIDYRFLDTNPAFEAQTGLRNVRGKLMRELAPENEAFWYEIYGKVAMTGEPTRFTNEAKALNRWFDVSAYRVGGRDSRKVAIVFNDITERMQAEEALRKAHAELEYRVEERTLELKSAVNVLQEEVAEREEAERNLHRLNRLYAVLSETDQAIVRSADRDALFRDFCRIAVEDGGFLLSWVGLVDAESGQVRMVAASGATAYLDDNRITANEEPAGEGPTGISIREGTYYICNDFQNDPCTRPWHDRGRAHGIRASASVALKQEGRVIGALALYAEEKDFFDRQHVELLRQVGTEISFALDNLDREARRRKAEHALKIETGRRLQALEELRAKEQMLMQQSRQAAMGEMIGNIAHQWRQPLNTLGLIVQELPINYEMGAFTKENLDESVKRATQVIQHMSQTIDDFRNFFRPDKEKTPFKINDAMARTISLIEGSFREQGITIATDTPDDIFIHGYPNEYSQVILNILVNARDAFVERPTGLPRVVLIKLFRENGRAVLVITDNAGGIAEDILEKIFDPYFTTKGPDKGTGIGLFMAKTIIEKNMGGRLYAGNTGDGAEFRIEV